MAKLSNIMKPAFLLGLIGLFFLVFYRSRHPARWAQEPSSFLGISLGVPLSRSAQKCKEKSPVYPCIDTGLENAPYFAVDIPDADMPGATRMATVEEEDGRVVSVELKMSTPELMRSDLLERYGKPTSTDWLDSYLTWEGKNVDLTYSVLKANGTHGALGFATMTLNSWHPVAPIHKNQF